MKLPRYRFAGPEESVSLTADTSVERPWYESAFDVIGEGLKYQQQRDLLKINADLLKAGKQPLDVSAISPQVNVGLSKDVQRIVMFSVAGLVGIGLILAMQRKK